MFETEKTGGFRDEKRSKEAQHVCLSFSVFGAEI